MKILAVVPTKLELNAMLKACQEPGYRGEVLVTGRQAVTAFPELGTTIALGGLGKKRLALRTQELIDTGHFDLVICAGAAGALAPGPAKGDVVIATETVEYDLRKKLDAPQAAALSRLRTHPELVPPDPAERAGFPGALRAGRQRGSFSDDGFSACGGLPAHACARGGDGRSWSGAGLPK